MSLLPRWLAVWLKSVFSLGNLNPLRGKYKYVYIIYVYICIYVCMYINIQSQSAKYIFLSKNHIWIMFSWLIHVLKKSMPALRRTLTFEMVEPTPLKNMKIKWDYCSQYIIGKSNSCLKPPTRTYCIFDDLLIYPPVNLYRYGATILPSIFQWNLVPRNNSPSK